MAGCALSLALGRLLHPRGGQERDVREARRLAHTLGQLKGPFAKLGQFASLRVDLLTPPVRDALAGLRERVPALPFPWIRQVIEQELGRPLEQCFVAFDPAPLGAASIAQVHRARLADGREVAVKVQHPWLEGSLPADLGILRLLFRAVAGGRLRARAVFDEFADGVREELDFRREARVAAEIADNLKDDDRILVPEIVEALSSRRVLTMAYHPTIPIHDRGDLERRGIPAEEVLDVIARAYAKQVFVDGLFHADPHPGNLFVVDEPEAARRPRVLFVDFGLSKHLRPELRRELRQGVYALLQGDLPAFLAGMQRMDMIAPGAEPGVRAAVAEMFERLRGEGGSPLGMGGDRVLALKDEAKTLLNETPGLALPSDLLLYAKTLSYLFGLGAELAPQVDLMKLTVPYLLRFLASKDA